MSKELVPAHGLIKWSPDIFCVVRFSKSRAQVYKTCVDLASNATYYVEGEEDGRLYHHCAFAKTSRDISLAYIFLELVRKLKDHICFINGEPIKINWRLLNVINCYSRALNADRKEAYCHVVTREALDDGNYYICPCNDLEGFLMIASNPNISIKDQVQAIAEENLQSHCPLFDLSKLEKAPIRYWD